MDEEATVFEVLQDLEFSYAEAPDCTYVVPKGTALEVGEAACVLGVSGSGKSTVMTLLAALRRFHRGAIRYALDGETAEVSTSTWQQRVGPRLWGHIGFAFQRPELIRSLNVAANLGLAGYGGDAPALFSPSEWRDVRGSRVWRLSGGQVQRLGLIRAFASAPRLVFLDEPTNNLDRGNRRQVAAFVDSCRSQCALVVVSHDTDFVEALRVDRRFELREEVVGRQRRRTLRSVERLTERGRP